jgi:hypothetical protein
MLQAPPIKLCNLIPVRMLYFKVSYRTATAVSLVTGRHLTATHRTSGHGLTLIIGNTKTYVSSNWMILGGSNLVFIRA